MSKTSGILVMMGLLVCCSVAWPQARVGGRGSTTAPTPTRSRPTVEEQAFPIEQIDGLTLDSALIAIRAKVPEFNYAIVRSEGVRPDYPTLPKMNVKNLQIGQFLDFVRVNFAVDVGYVGDETAPFYTFRILQPSPSGGRRGGGGGPPTSSGNPEDQPVVTVYRLTPIINGLIRNQLAKDPKEALTAILSLVESVMNQAPEKGGANLKVHEPTQMLTFQGSMAKFILLENTLSKMQPPANELGSVGSKSEMDQLKVRIMLLEDELKAARAFECETDDAVNDDEATHKLTQSMSAGDVQAVEVFYRTYFDWLYAQARRASRRDESFCLDVVQDSVLRIIRTIRPVKFETQLRAWMRLVVQTTALDLLRSETRRQKRELIAVPASHDAAGEFEESDYQWLRQQVQKLDPQIVTMIELRFEKRWTLGRISKLLGLSIGTIDGRLRKALRQLREIVPEDWDD